jgi:hypothetical protein
MRTTGSPETSRPGVHLMLVCPGGQRVCCASRSIEGAQIIALARPPWMARRPKGRADHGDLMRCLGADEYFGIHIAAIAQMSAREQTTGREGSVGGGPDDASRRGRWGRQRRRHDSRLAIVAGCREMDLVADPGDPACRAIPGVWLVGGGDHLGGRGPLLHRTPAQRSRRVGVRLRPDLPPSLNGRNLLPPGQVRRASTASSSRRPSAALVAASSSRVATVWGR